MAPVSALPAAVDGRLGEDVTEVLDYVPGHFQVIRHVRPKYACQALRCHHPGTRTGDADAAWPRHARHARASAGLEILRSPAAV